MHKLWYRRNCLRILCSPQLGEAANRFTWRMHHALWENWQKLPPGCADVYEYMSKERDPFITLATNELYSRGVYEDAQPNR